MKHEMTAAKAQVASGGGFLTSAAVTPFLPDGTPWWAYLIVWALPQIMASLVYIVPNQPK